MLLRLIELPWHNAKVVAKRNTDRFPADFMFRLTEKEIESLIFQSGRSKGRVRATPSTSDLCPLSPPLLLVSLPLGETDMKRQ